MTRIDQIAGPSTAHSRLPTSVLPLVEETPSFIIDAANKSFKHQYANIYFIRLKLLREHVEREAERKWKEVSGSPVLVPRVLEVVRGQLCFIVGTVYMEMPLKANVLEDIGRDHSIPAPPPRDKIYSADDHVTLEDESGRIQLVGEKIEKERLVTGVILGALGYENSNGDFQVVDVCYAGMAAQPAPAGHTNEMDVDDTSTMNGASSKTTRPEEYVAFVSGLDIGSPTPSDAQIQMLVEYLTGEAGGLDDQIYASQISRLVILGNSLSDAVNAQIAAEDSPKDKDKKGKRYGYDNASFSPHPTISLSGHLHDLARTLPIHLLPGASDPSGTILPQQPLPRMMFGPAATFSSFTCETNPTYIRLSPGPPQEQENIPPSGPTPAEKSDSWARTILATSGQPLDDMFKYLPSAPAVGLGLAESTLRWRHMAPTAPDTLWCHPFFTKDPFILSQTPDVYAIGCQPKFSTKLVKDDKRRCRVVLVPNFAETGILVLVGMRRLDAKVVRFAVDEVDMDVGEIEADV